MIAAVVVVNTYLVGFGLRIETGTERITIIVDIFNITQTGQGTGIHLPKCRSVLPHRSVAPQG